MRPEVNVLFTMLLATLGRTKLLLRNRFQLMRIDVGSLALRINDKSIILRIIPPLLGRQG